VFSAAGDDRIIDLGFVNDDRKLALIDRADLVCLPSDADVFPLVFAEAWARGKPVVTGRFHGADGVVRHGVDGLIVDTDPEPLAHALLRLLRNRPELRRLGDNGRRRFERHLSWHAVADLVASGYRDALLVPRPGWPAPSRTSS
jgi:glycosyltransferase involved in cell wall biosynthesis